MKMILSISAVLLAASMTMAGGTEEFGEGLTCPIAQSRAVTNAKELIAVNDLKGCRAGKATPCYTQTNEHGEVIYVSSSAILCK